MRIALVTQNETVFLPSALDYLLRRLPASAEVAACIILSGSSVRGNSAIKKAINLARIFGPYFVLRNGLVHAYRTMSGYTIEGIAKDHQISIIQLSRGINHPDSLSQISDLDLDILINIAGAEIFRKKLIDLPRICTLNLHTSKLPHYRGMLPSFWVMLNDETETAVSVFAVDEGIDTGPVLAQLPLKIKGLSQAQLIRLTKHMGMDAIVLALDSLGRGRQIEYVEKEGVGSYYSFPTRADVKRFRQMGKRFF